jgi:uncharacterized protein (TIGR02271 family)
MTDQISNLRGRDVYGSDGEKIGTVGQVYTTEPAGQPAWASVHTGLFGLKESMVPLSGARMQGDQLQVSFDKHTVKDAPNVDKDADEPLTGDQVRELYEYYRLGWDAQSGNTDAEGFREQGYQSGSYADDSRTDDSRDRDDNAMTRSEERLNVGTQTEQTGTARLRKHVVTENVQTTVPVQREEVRLEREPITDANRGAALGGPDLTESEHEMTVYAERPVVDKETVPVERVRLGKETVTDEHTVGGNVRKERIDADLPDEQDRRRLG